ncbi:MAG: hypothetical protein ABSF69_12955 [Polyangiaceae bacterium]|jgi:hypothetical protein
MRVAILRLVAGLRRTLWKHGFAAPERLQHRVDEHGDHHVALVIRAEEADYDPPATRSGPMVGASTGWFSEGPKRKE